MSGVVPANQALLDALRATLGEAGVLTGADTDGYCRDWRGLYRGRAMAVIRPADTESVATAVRLCVAHRVALVPQGGNTSMVGGAAVHAEGGEIVLSLARMNRIRALDPVDMTMTVEAGVVLQRAQDAAREAGCLLPLSISSEGSAQIGGILATNAGGNNTLRYGNARELVLGIEAVLPDGSVFSGLKRLRKDNTGYDLKQLLIGGEGTLGVVTAAALKLFPILRSRAVAVVGLASAEAAIQLLARAKDESGGAVEAFELVSRRGVELAMKNIPDVRDPLSSPFPWIVLVEIASSESGHAEAAMERLLAASLEDGLIEDAALAQNQAQAKAFWRLREEQSAAQKPEGVTWKHDVSVPVSSVPQFLARATAAAEALAPGGRVVAFGHVGDGNIHYDVLQPLGGDGRAHAALREEGSRRIHDIVHALGGSISAEHGLGVMKSAEALRYKDPNAVELMRRIRAAFDPNRIMNPRVLF